MRVGPENVGRRVVLRHRLPDGRATDVLGELMAWDADAGYARVATARGEVQVPLADIVLGKPVPPAPRRRRGVTGSLSVTELHDVMADGWQPLERAEYGGWRLRAAQGFTGRANSVLPLGDPRDGLPDGLATAIDHVEGWYADRSLPARFCVTWRLGAGPGDPAYGTDPLEAELVRRGYRLDYPSLVLTRSLVGYSHPAAESASREHGLVVDVQDELGEGFLKLYRYRGEDLPPVAAQLLMSAPAQAFVSIRRPGEGRTIAIGRAASSRGWTGITAVEVASDHRRQGLAQVVMAALLGWAGERGDDSVYLQVARANAPARGLYDGLGFTAHSGYHYRIQPD